MKNLVLSLILLFLSACSTTTKEEAPVTSYSQETMKTFEEIEREQVLEYYRQLRARENQNQQRTAPPPPAPKPLQKFHTQKPKPKTPRRPKSSAIAANPEELEKEVSQNLSFFCMKTRSQSRFSAEGSCEEFTTRVESQCRGQFESNDRRLFNCVRDKLK
jgi:hypothetical protein